MSDLSDDNRIVTHIRLVVHTVSPNTPYNHWSIYLLLADNQGSVRLHMTDDGETDQGAFMVAPELQYALTGSALQHWDYPAVNNLPVKYVYRLIKAKNRHKYRMTGEGYGCRYWVWVVLKDLEDQGYLTQPGASTGIWTILQYSYQLSKGQVVFSPLEMQCGEFYE